jgi:DeoR/GlpR family transcriptional regulator of sugar metabolism
MSREAQVVTSGAGYQRQEQIADWVLQHRFVTVQDLIARFGVSYSTINRDLAALEIRTDLQRVRGGLMYRPAGLRRRTDRRPAHDAAT